MDYAEQLIEDIRMDLREQKEEAKQILVDLTEKLDKEGIDKFLRHTE